MVENFGSYLKHERELRGVSLEEISGDTKIPLRFLKALEENSFDKLPGEIFIKGYIRSYANIIGSDFGEMLNIYKEFVEFKNQAIIPSPPPSLWTQQPKTFLTFGLSILVFVSLVFGVRFLITKVDDPEENKASLVQKQAEITIPEPLINSDISEDLVEDKVMDVKGLGSSEPAIPELSASVSDQLAEGLDKKQILPQQESAKLVVQNLSVSRVDLYSKNRKAMVKPLRLTIRAKEDSWFNMTIDEFKEEDFILPTGTAKTFWGDANFRLTVGNKTGVELSLNGKDLTFPESKDRVVKDFIITSELLE